MTERFWGRLRPTAHLFAAVALAACSLAVPTGAYARYSAIDENNGSPIQIDFGGYCDTQFDVGDQCDESYQLPYSVSFGGVSTDQVSLRDDGSLQFVGQLLGPPGSTDQFEVLGTVVGGYNTLNSFPQLASLKFQGVVIVATWFTCGIPQICYTDKYSVLMTPVIEGGFDILVKGVNRDILEDPFIGWFLPGSSELSDSGNRFFLPATFAPDVAINIPEPSSWALLILGLAGMGAALRQRRKVSLGRP